MRRLGGRSSGGDSEVRKLGGEGRERPGRGRAGEERRGEESAGQLPGRAIGSAALTRLTWRLRFLARPRSLSAHAPARLPPAEAVSVAEPAGGLEPEGPSGGRQEGRLGRGGRRGEGSRLQAQE